MYNIVEKQFVYNQFKLLVKDIGNFKSLNKLLKFKVKYNNNLYGFHGHNNNYLIFMLLKTNN